MRHCFQIGTFLSLFLGLLTGCASLPGSINVSSREKRFVSDSFKAVLARQQECGTCLDANVTVTFNSFLQSGTVSGYFQTKSPSSIKFVGENPFGQPIIIFTTDGNTFSYATVSEQKVYEGDVTSSTYKKYAPTGFRPDFGFYWLVGRVLPVQPMVLDIGRQKDGENYWIKLSNDQENIFSLVLFDSEEQVVRRHILVDDKDKMLLDVQYSGFNKPASRVGEGFCILPGDVIVKSSGHRASLEIHFRDWFEHADFPDNDFELIFPSHFEKIEVQ
jgi:hypothetical protein